MNLDATIAAGRANAEHRFGLYQEAGTDPSDIYYEELNKLASILHAASQNATYNATRLRLKRITRAEAHEDLFDRRRFLIQSVIAFEVIADRLIGYQPEPPLMIPDPMDNYKK